jgi:Predicted glycosyltransferases
MEKPVISVVLGTYNRLKFLKLTIQSIRKELLCLNFPGEIIVIEGGSTDGTLSWLTQQKDIITIVQHNRGTWQGKPIKRRSWGYFMNLGFKCAQGKYICMISDDCLLIPNALVNGFSFFEQQLKEGKKVGSLAFYWRNIPFFYTNWTKEKTYLVQCVFNIPVVNSGMYLKQALEEINYADEETYLFYSGDLDICLRLTQHGYISGIAPDSYIEHYFHASPTIRKQNSLNDDDITFYEIWAPQYNWTSKEYLSASTKEFTDATKTVKKFTKAHFTNTKVWIPFYKGIIKRKIEKLFFTKE